MFGKNYKFTIPQEKNFIQQPQSQMPKYLQHFKSKVEEKKQINQLQKENDQEEVSAQGFICAGNMVNLKKRKIKPEEVQESTFQQPRKVNDPPKNLQKNPNTQGLDQQLIERIEAEIVDGSKQTTKWSDIAGLSHVRSQVEEIALWPLLNPELFKGFCEPGSGLLLFGPPGTGKTMIGKAIAAEASATFFSISASSLTSKYIGEGEKMVRTLFKVAQMRQPSVIFIDEVDSLLSLRSDKENEASRAIKTEFMVQLEGCNKNGDEKLLFVGATNRPQELDDAIKRRFQKRLYIPLPNKEGRLDHFKIIQKMERERGKVILLGEDEMDLLVSKTRGYSGADIKNLCTEASMICIREAIKARKNVKEVRMSELRQTNMEDFVIALKNVKATVGKKDLEGYLQWNNEFGSYNYDENELGS